MLLTVAATLVVSFVAVSMLITASAAEGRVAYRFVRHLRVRHVALGAVAVVTTYGVSVALWSVPGLRWGWWSLLGGTGNPATGSSSALSSPVVPVVMIAALAAAVLPLAHVEELMFRDGAHRWSPGRRVVMAVLFGLSHTLIGVPLVFGCALSVTGLVLTLVYVRTHRRVERTPGLGWQADLVAVRDATLVHAVHNYLVVAAVVVSALLS